MHKLKYTFEGESEELQHYGVLGMRWGVRHDKEYKAQKSKITNAYRKDLEKSQSLYKSERSKYGRNEADRRAEKRGDSAEAKRRNAINKAKVDTANRLYSGNSKEANRRIQTRSTAKTLGISGLLGSYGALQYDRARAEGNSKGKAAVKGTLARLGDTALSNAVGVTDYLQDRQARKMGARSGKHTTNDFSLSGTGGQTKQYKEYLKKQKQKRYGND